MAGRFKTLGEQKGRGRSIECSRAREKGLESETRALFKKKESSKSYIEKERYAYRRHVPQKGGRWGINLRIDSKQAKMNRTTITEG